MGLEAGVGPQVGSGFILIFSQGRSIGIAQAGGQVAQEHAATIRGLPPQLGFQIALIQAAKVHRKGDPKALQDLRQLGDVPKGVRDVTNLLNVAKLLRDPVAEQKVADEGFSTDQKLVR